MEAFEAECTEKAEARAAQAATQAVLTPAVFSPMSWEAEARAAGALSRREQKNQSFWQKKKEHKKARAEQ